MIFNDEFLDGLSDIINIEIKKFMASGGTVYDAVSEYASAEAQLQELRDRASERPPHQPAPAGFIRDVLDAYCRKEAYAQIVKQSKRGQENDTARGTQCAACRGKGAV